MPTVPPFTDPCWVRLAHGAMLALDTQHRGTELMIDRLAASPAPVMLKANELHSFFSKWQESLGDELAQIRRL